MTNRNTRRGFTLIELLIVVLIIGILAAVAVPQYQKAVLKSRFSSLMPTTQAIRDGQEMYFLTNGHYADVISKLDVTATNNTDMTVTLSDDSDYAYTMATRPNIKNNLIMYQKHSKNFPGEIHCEAKENDTLAQGVCTSLGATQNIGEIVTSGYITHILEGAGDSDDLRLRVQLQTIAATQCPENQTRYTCIVNDKTVSKCDTNYGQIEQGECVQTKRGSVPYEYVYDEAGNLKTAYQCESMVSDACTQASVYEYNSDHSYKIRQTSCSSGTISKDLSCEDGYFSHTDESYNSNNQKTFRAHCSGPQVNSTTGECAEYATVSITEYDYNTGRVRYRVCSSSTGTECTSWYDWR